MNNDIFNKEYNLSGYNVDTSAQILQSQVPLAQQQQQQQQQQQLHSQQQLSFASMNARQYSLDQQNQQQIVTGMQAMTFPESSARNSPNTLDHFSIQQQQQQQQQQSNLPSHFPHLQQHQNSIANSNPSSSTSNVAPLSPGTTFSHPELTGLGSLSKQQVNYQPPQQRLPSFSNFQMLPSRNNSYSSMSNLSPPLVASNYSPRGSFSGAFTKSLVGLSKSEKELQQQQQQSQHSNPNGGNNNASTHSPLSNTTSKNFSRATAASFSVPSSTSPIDSKRRLSESYRAVDPNHPAQHQPQYQQLQQPQQSIQHQQQQFRNPWYDPKTNSAVSPTDNATTINDNNNIPYSQASQRSSISSTSGSNFSFDRDNSNSMLIPPLRSNAPVSGMKLNQRGYYNDTELYVKPNDFARRQSLAPSMLASQTSQYDSAMSSSRLPPKTNLGPIVDGRSSEIGNTLPPIDQYHQHQYPQQQQQRYPYHVMQHQYLQQQQQQHLQQQQQQLQQQYNQYNQQSPYMSRSPSPAPRMTKVKSESDLKPVVNSHPKFRRMSPTNNTYVSPLYALTTSISVTYSMCRPEFDYKSSKNPRRVLTKPSQPTTNNGSDNENSDYILYVNDVLGGEENKKYLVLDILGQGTFGQVVKCQNLKSQEIVAIKIVRSSPAHLSQSLIEINFVEMLNTKIDPNNEHHFLQLKDKFLHKNHLCIVFELLSSNLYELIRQNQFHGLTIKLIRKFTIQILDSLCILKDARIIHCDLKPENILLVSIDKPDLKVIDFGSACHERQTMCTYIQSRFYRAPEVILGLSYTASVDMWSLGCIVAELFLGLPLFPGTSEYNQLTRIIDMLGFPPAWMIDIGKSSMNFLKKLPKNEVNSNNNTNNNITTNYTQRAPKSNSQYCIKPVEEYCKEFNVNEQPSKNYFNHKELESIIMKYQLPKKNMNQQAIEKEMNLRRCLIHFLRGTLNLNPLERWTPHEALLHPFITEQPFTGTWSPPSRLYQSHQTQTQSKNSEIPAGSQHEDNSDIAAGKTLKQRSKSLQG